MEDNLSNLVKLIRRKDGNLEYLTVYIEKGDLFIHQGNIGEQGQITKKFLIPFQNPQRIVAKTAEILVSEGYEYEQENEMTEYIVTYKMDINLKELMELKYKIEKIITKNLRDTGNGECEAGVLDIGNVKFYCYIHDKSLAEKTIVNCLQEGGYYDKAIIDFN